MEENRFKRIPNTNLGVSRDGIIINTDTGKEYTQYVSKTTCAYKMIGTKALGHTAEYVHALVVKAWSPESLKENSQIHHIDGNVYNNSLDNLVVLSKEVHYEIHKLKRAENKLNKLILAAIENYKNKQ